MLLLAALFLLYVSYGGRDVSVRARSRDKLIRIDIFCAAGRGPGVLVPSSCSGLCVCCSRRFANFTNCSFRSKGLAGRKGAVFPSRDTSTSGRNGVLLQLGCVGGPLAFFMRDGCYGEVSVNDRSAKRGGVVSAVAFNPWVSHALSASGALISSSRFVQVSVCCRFGGRCIISMCLLCPLPSPFQEGVGPHGSDMCDVGVLFCGRVLFRRNASGEWKEYADLVLLFVLRQ